MSDADSAFLIDSVRLAIMPYRQERVRGFFLKHLPDTIRRMAGYEGFVDVEIAELHERWYHGYYADNQVRVFRAYGHKPVFN